MADDRSTPLAPLTLEDRREPEPAVAGPARPSENRLPLWIPTWVWVAILAGMDLVTTIVGLALGNREENPVATIVGGVSIFLAIKVTLTAVMCWRWRRLGEKHWSTLSRAVVLSILAAVVCWNLAVIAMR